MFVGNPNFGLTIGPTVGGLTFEDRCVECGNYTPAGWDRCTFHTTMHRLEDIEKKTEERNEQTDRELDRLLEDYEL